MPGVIMPYSAYPDSPSRLYPDIYVGKGSGSKYEEGLGVIASLDTNAIWHLRFKLPPELPAETMKLHLYALADAQSGNALINPFWAPVGAEEDPSSVTLTAEGTSTATWQTGDDDVYKEIKVTLNDGGTPVGNDIIVMSLTFVSSGWTLAAKSVWIPSIIWE